MRLSPATLALAVLVTVVALAGCSSKKAASPAPTAAPLTPSPTVQRTPDRSPPPDDVVFHRPKICSTPGEHRVPDTQMMSVPRTHVVHIISAAAEGGGALIQGKPANFVCGNVEDSDGFWEDAPLPTKAYHLPPTATVVLLEGSQSVYGTVAGLIKQTSDKSQLNAIIITNRAGDLTTIEELYHP